MIPPYQVHHDGVTYGSGEHVELSDEAAEHGLKFGWLEPVDTERTTRRPKKTTA